jgi:hypothetical protein
MTQTEQLLMTFFSKNEKVREIIDKTNGLLPYFEIFSNTLEYEIITARINPNEKYIKWYNKVLGGNIRHIFLSWFNDIYNNLLNLYSKIKENTIEKHILYRGIKDIGTLGHDLKWFFASDIARYEQDYDKLTKMNGTENIMTEPEQLLMTFFDKNEAPKKIISMVNDLLPYLKNGSNTVTYKFIMSRINLNERVIKLYDRKYGGDIDSIFAEWFSNIYNSLLELYYKIRRDIPDEEELLKQGIKDIQSARIGFESDLRTEFKRYNEKYDKLTKMNVTENIKINCSVCNKKEALYIDPKKVKKVCGIICQKKLYS